MTNNAFVLNSTPWNLLLKIVSTFDGSWKDPRGQVSFEGAHGKIWTGIPIRIVEDTAVQYVVLANKDTDKLTFVDRTHIVAFEFESPSAIASLIATPWLRDSRYSAMTKLQAARELGDISKGLNNVPIEANFDSFSSDEKVPGAIAVWAQQLKAAVDKITATPEGKEAWQSIAGIQVRKGDKELKIKKDGRTLIVELSLESQNFSETNIEKLLNEVL